jgi:hypothetical protein
MCCTVRRTAIGKLRKHSALVFYKVLAVVFGWGASDTNREVRKI